MQGSLLRVLVVDDDPAVVAITAAVLTAKGCSVRSAVDPLTALAMVAEFSPEVLVTDVAMPAMLGVELACRVLEAAPACRIVFHTGELGMLRNCALSAALPNFSIVEKPANIHELLRAVVGHSARKRPPMSVRTRRLDGPALRPNTRSIR